MKTRISHCRLREPKSLTPLAFTAAVLVGNVANAQMPSAWNSAAVSSGVDYVTTGAATTLTWSDSTAWSGTLVPTNAANQTVSLEPRQTGAMTVTIDGTYTVGSLTSRNPNNNLAFTGTGKLVFDNGSNQSIWNLNSRVTRYTCLRPDVNVDIQLNSDLDIRVGSARADEAAVGRIGKVISGTGKLTLTLGQNDASTARFFKIGNGGTANTYSGGTEIRHIESISAAGQYGAGFTSQGDTLLVNALSTGSFGTGDLTLNSQGLNQTAVTAVTAATGGLQLKLSANNVMGPTAKLTQSGDGAGLVLLESTQQTIGGLETTGTTAQQERKRVSSLAGASLTLNTQSAQTYAYAGIISGPTSLTIDGSGTQILGNANTYTGPTTVIGGTLSLGTTGSLGTTTLDVQPGGTLAGSGTIGGATTISGIHAPGSSPGLQTFSAGLAYTTGSFLEWDFVGDTLGIRGTDFDGIDVTGGDLLVNAGATLRLLAGGVDYSAAAWDSARSFTVIDYLGAGTSGGNFALDTGGAGPFAAEGNWGVANSGGDIVVTWTPVPEPDAALLGALGLGLLCRRRHPGSDR